MDSAGEPTLPLRRLSVDAKMQAASWKVRMISTTRAWPAVVLLLSCKPSRATVIHCPWALASPEGPVSALLLDLGWQSQAREAPPGSPHKAPWWPLLSLSAPFPEREEILFLSPQRSKIRLLSERPLPGLSTALSACSSPQPSAFHHIPHQLVSLFPHFFPPRPLQAASPGSPPLPISPPTSPGGWRAAGSHRGGARAEGDGWDEGWRAVMGLRLCADRCRLSDGPDPPGQEKREVTPAIPACSSRC